MNSREWWEEYFKKGLWDYYDGGSQTLFFAKTLYENLAPNVLEDIVRNKMSICDVGCAEGEATNFFQTKIPDSTIDGIDLSANAIERAKKKFPNEQFVCMDLQNLSENRDVIISSNVLEHLSNPDKELKNLSLKANKYLIIMLPYKDMTGESTHINIFDDCFFAEACPESFKIVQMKVIDTSKMEKTYWPGEQVLVIYERTEKRMGTQEHELVAKKETWDSVAETYSIELEDGDFQLARDIEKILIGQGLKPGDSLIEMGCGSGHLSACLAQKGYRVTLVDFSQTALSKARQTFSKYGLKGNFIQGDLFNLDSSIETHDFAWNSGVMEHFGDEEIVTLMHNIGRCARKGVLYLVPNSSSIAYLLMRARLMAKDEWIYGQEYLRTDYDVILKSLGYKHIVTSYITTAAISAYQMWKAENEQGNVSELYKSLLEEHMLPTEEGYLVSYFASEAEAECGQQIQYHGHAVEQTRIFDLVAKKIGYYQNKMELGKCKIELEESVKQLKECTNELEECKKEKEKLTVVIAEYEEEKSNLVAAIKQHEEERDYFIECMADRDAEQLLKEDIQEMAQRLAMYQAILKQKDEYLAQTQDLCNHFATGKLMQLNHLLYRIKGQLIRGTKEDKKDFWAWLRGRIRKTNRTIGAGVIYNPWMVLNEKLKEALVCQAPLISIKENDVQVQPTDMVLEENCDTVELPLVTKKILKAPYTKYDVIILSVIDYNFRHQRPQHFATRFASNGHRVYYVNANFVRPDSVSLQEENLHVVDFACTQYNAIYGTDGMDTLDWMKEKFDHLIYTQAIRDALIVVDYPNWVYGAEYLREHYGFKMVLDYMDDYTGFLGTAEDFLKDNCIKLLQESDLVVASSQFLFEVANKHTDAEKIAVVRNGTEVEHFYQAISMQSSEKERKVIGYYGAVAHWFAWEKICYLAKEFPECDIVIVGEVTEHREKFDKFTNIKLLGEKPYKELPKYLADFDVCLIPFDTSTDLIKATNPVKFYEYLSAGKKIVATEIPELMPYKDRYVYMSNEDEQFAEYVRMCLDGTDTLDDEKSCIAFARENDWQKRYESFEEACVAKIPMISIVVLTYNNLAFNKACITSILQNTAYANYELIIVDNQSTDGTVDYLQELESENISNVRVIYNNANLGFASGNNIGMEVAQGEYVLLLNNDTVVSRGWLTAMVKHLEGNLRYAMCNPVTNSIGNESKIRARYHNAEEMQEFAYMYTASHMGEEYTDADRLPLFATLIRKQVIDEVGMLDDSYKIGMFEDDDYSQAVLQAGYEIVIADDAFVHHVNNASFKKLSDQEYKQIFEENKKLFEDKWGKKWCMPKYRANVFATSNDDVYL